MRARCVPHRSMIVNDVDDVALEGRMLIRSDPKSEVYL